jgi:uncharacterized membrane protein (GlpM family)
LLSIVGAALTVVLALARGMGYALLGGMTPLACGAALLLFYFIKKKSSNAG